MALHHRVHLPAVSLDGSIVPRLLFPFNTIFGAIYIHSCTFCVQNVIF
nr:MAG TPA: hypothetical protein [Bacteriophage sp.]